MDLIKAIILGIVEGITEFLPISSTGHLLLTSKLLSIPETTYFEIVIQLGAILAVVWYYRGDLWSQLRTVGSDARVRRLWLCVFIAFLPAAVIGLVAEDHLDQILSDRNTRLVAGSLIAGGVVLWLVELRRTVPSIEDIFGVRPRQALIIGLAQVLALIPGVSRSGSSIVGGLLCGLSREAATAFSFYLALPTLGAATMYKLLKNVKVIMASGQAMPLAVGTAVSFITALLAIGWLLRFVSSNDFRGFAYYRVAIGVVILLFMA